MFAKRKTTINGVELPEDFNVGSVINNIAISADGKKYAAITKGRGVVIADIPADGRINVDGTMINYRRSGGISVSGSNIQMSSISGGSVVISGSGGQISIGGRNLEYEIDRGYEEINRLVLKESANDVNLSLSEDRKVYVKGNTCAEPLCKDGRLSIDGLEGKLLVPKSSTELELDIKTSAGDIDGEVAHKGRIRTSAGDITIELYAPVSLEVSTSAGDISVRGMICEGDGRYSPPNAKPLGTLVLETSAGDIEVRYRA